MERKKEELYSVLLKNSGLSSARCLELTHRLADELVVRKKKHIKKEVVTEDITEPNNEYKKEKKKLKE